MRIFILIILQSIWFVFNSFSQTLLTNAHAHNDYWHTRPLIQAMKNGFMSVEADCHLIDNRMLVAHEKIFTKKKRTLEKLYLNPLFEKAKENNFQSVFRNGPSGFILYIDIKADCENFIPFLDSILQNYEAMLSKFVDGKKSAGAVQVLVDHCGNDEYILNSKSTYLALAGNFSDVDKKSTDDRMPRISFSYKSLINWKGKGEMPEEEREKLRNFIQKIHNNGYEIRLWAAGNKIKVWNELVNAGADWINVDRLKKFRKFMENKKKITTSRQ